MLMELINAEEGEHCKLYGKSGARYRWMAYKYMHEELGCVLHRIAAESGYSHGAVFSGVRRLNDELGIYDDVRERYREFHAKADNLLGHITVCPHCGKELVGHSKTDLVTN